MSGIYIHIPFCKQACHYCDFHFSTSIKKKAELISALIKELELRKHELEGHTVETIYFGGGTPSLLSIDELRMLIDSVYENYKVIPNSEITLEANPDDLTNQQIDDLATLPINRLSIGIQSFFDQDLKLMNRAHNANDAKQCLEEATKYFDNITIDLIYGIPGLSNKRWIENIDVALSFGIPHVSAYALTVESRTALEAFIKKGKVPNIDEELVEKQFQILIEKLEASGFMHYELSNFGKPDYFSKHNTSYWQGRPYLGIGPSAHSFTGDQRSWNVRNNSIYINSISHDVLPRETEKLSKTDQYNEYVMTGLRTLWGVSLEKVERDFGNMYKSYLLEQSQKYIDQHLLYIKGDNVLVTKKGKFLGDGIASHLFKINES